MNSYESIKQYLANGWNTWNTRNVLSHVLLPEGVAFNLAFKDPKTGWYLKEALFGKSLKDEEKVRPGPHATFGTYTELMLQWRDIEVRVQSATEEQDLVLLITPISKHRSPPILIVESGILWNRPGTLHRYNNLLCAQTPSRQIILHSCCNPTEEYNVQTQTPYLAFKLDRCIGLSGGKPRTDEQIVEIIHKRRSEMVKKKNSFGLLAESYEAMQTALAWDTIYEPSKQRVISPVSRNWNVGHGGYILFCWDTYFAALMAAVDSKELAYANAIEITSEATEKGFVPNVTAACGYTSLDRSQPPVGSMVVKALYNTFGEKWFLEYLFPALFRWNEWWPRYRDNGGFLCWGSNPFEPRVDNYWEQCGVNDRQGAAFESGLDNSPMYDDVPFDPISHQLKLADVGLMSLYISDCRYLADIAKILGKTCEEKELRNREAYYRNNLSKLWDDKIGIFLNRRLDNGEVSRRISPTNFYPLIAAAATPQQARRMIEEHFDNPSEFQGDWILPSISRNDPSYPEQDYWRGRIWPPMNFLVYLGLRNYSFDKARKELVEKSIKLLLKEWTQKGHVHENYCAYSGDGCNKTNSDALYHWGGLLGLIGLIEEGYLQAP